MSWVFLQKPWIVQLLKNFPIPYTWTCNWSLSWARLIKPVPPRPISLMSILILSSHLHLDLPSCLFPYGFPNKTLHSFFSHQMYHISSHLILLNLIILIIFAEKYKSWSSRVCSVLILYKSLFPVIAVLASPLSTFIAVLRLYHRCHSCDRKLPVAYKTSNVNGYILNKQCLLAVMINTVCRYTLGNVQKFKITKFTVAVI
jgi:hypothetical protein